MTTYDESGDLESGAPGVNQTAGPELVETVWGLRPKPDPYGWPSETDPDPRARSPWS